MKLTAIATLFTALLFAGCIYEAPLVAEAKIPVNPELIGVWEKKSKDGSKKKKKGDRILIFKFSETEYLIQNPVDGERITYRAYQIKLGGKSCVQMEVIGSDEGAPDWKDDKPRPFLVSSFEVTDDTLVLGWLNSKLVSDELNTTEALQEAFLKHTDDKDLFTDLKEYRRVKK